MALNVEAMMNSAVEPIYKRLSSDERLGRIGKLVTSPPPLSIRDNDFKRFKVTKINGKNVIYLSNGDFFTYFKCDDKYYLCISCEFFQSNEIDSIISIMDKYGLFLHEFEPCFFMHITHFLSDYYKVKTSISSNELIEVLGLTLRENQHDYIGHEIQELIDIYTPLMIFNVNDDSVVLEKDNWFLACILALDCKSLQSKLVDGELIYLAGQLFNLEKNSLENLYLSITASHPKYLFIEIYRCLEAIYYLPWMHQLKTKSGFAHDAFTLAKIVSKTIFWKEKERDSINEIFKMIPFDLILNSNLERISILNGLSIEDTDGCRVKLSNYIYNLRNQSVHQQDYEEIDSYKLMSSDWLCLSKFVYKVVDYFYRNFSSDINVYICNFETDSY